MSSIVFVDAPSTIMEAVEEVLEEQEVLEETVLERERMRLKMNVALPRFRRSWS